MDWRAAYLARVSGLTGGSYWGERPQGATLPALVMFAVDDARPQHLKDWDLAPGRVQVDTYAATSKVAWELMDAAIEALAPGDIGNGHVFSRSEVALGPRDLPERVGNTTIFRVSADLIVHHTETDLIS